MERGPRALRVEAQDALIRGKVAAAALRRDWELLEEIARIVAQDAPHDLAVTDPARFTALRNAITRFHLAGWTHMTPERVRAVAADARAAVAVTEAPGSASAE